MVDRVEKAGLRVETALARFVENDVLAPLGMDAGAFWQGFADLLAKHAPTNRALLAKRDELQAQIDTWHKERAGKPIDMTEYKAFLTAIGYLVPEPGDFVIGTANVDPEIATMAGPQLVVPVLNARFALNAANARWGSLYDAFYGTDALPDAPLAAGKGYDPARGAAVVAAGRKFLNDALPGWDAALTGGACPHAFATLTGGAKGVMFEHNGLYIEIHVDRDHPVGATDELGISDVVLESALTSIIDMEDSVAAVDAEDKLLAYANWLGLMNGTLTAEFQKGGETMTRSLEPDRTYALPNGETLDLPGRSLLFVRNVGHLMTNPAILLPDGSELPEGIMDAVITSAIARHDLDGLGQYRNSRAGSIYIVKPKMHGPEECAFTNTLFDAVEDLLGLARHTIKVGVMDEERRTSANLAACIHAVKDRIVFINTGFLDRTGDEMHTSMQAGPMIRKGAMKTSDWIDAYEKRNVAIGLKHGLSGKAQIGKGMWAAPDRMGQMLVEKVGHPRTGANTAWVPSPTAATLHALHYHQVDVFALREAIAAQGVPAIERLLTVPLADGVNWSAEELREELDNNAQGLLGYVVRWIDQGVGCSKVPDINDVGLMEDRATLRISSQHMANWLLHGVVTEEQVMDALRRMAAKVDAQNAGDPAYEPLVGNEDGCAFQAAKDLVFKGVEQPSGYTEPLLHAWRQVKKGAK
ncbi:malate synthase G [Croceicoccus sp. BE223]|uniref:malate synthase G n=1 Tax=Croceicoccus sp. BE223 TaxID=2817716 RepID=UPI00285FEA07|nr:malate synthase G [Croceicoccus sp. BE223]MDR7101080.1 malate synthase [Croceicoccus sp. BE223]